MFASDQKREEPLALSFLPIDVPPTKTAASPLRVYLSAGDIERAFDNADFRPDAAIVPTNTDLRHYGGCARNATHARRSHPEAARRPSRPGRSNRGTPEAKTPIVRQ